MVPEIENNINKIIDVCKKMQVENLYVFGSGVRNEGFTPESDLDFLVMYHIDQTGMPPEEFDYFDLWFALEEITGRKVDLVVNHGIRNKYFREEIEKEKVLLYAA